MEQENSFVTEYTFFSDSQTRSLWVRVHRESTSVYLARNGKPDGRAAATGDDGRAATAVRRDGGAVHADVVHRHRSCRSHYYKN